MSELIDASCRIPGIQDTYTFVSWLTKNDRITFSGVVVKHSPLGGIGLFCSGDDAGQGERAGELLRIRLKYDYTVLLELLSKLSPARASLVKLVLRTLRPSTETSILECYFIAFRLCELLVAGHEDAALKDTALEDIDPAFEDIAPYLAILQNTQVGTLDIDAEAAERNRFFSRYQDSIAALRSQYDALVAALAHEKYIESKESDFGFTHNDFQHFEAIIRSRVLEIPYPDEDTPENDRSEDYVCNVTLVPFLDFVNHANELDKNAYFDVDRETGDILLMLRDDVSIKKGDEITICYSNPENVQSMIKTYGFIPHSTNEASPQIFEIIIPQDFLDEFLNTYNGNTAGETQKYSVIAKWLQIFPLVQLVLLQGKTFINYVSNSMPLLFVKGLKYNPNWQSMVGDFKGDDEEKNEVLEILKLQELKYDIITGIGNQRAVHLGQEFPNVSNILEIANMETEQDFLGLQAECTKMIIEYCKSTIATDLASLVGSLSVSGAGQQTILLSQYFTREVEVLQSFVKAYESGADVILPDGIASEEWAYESTPPKMYFGEE